MFKLVIEDDEGNKTVVPVIRDEITIGRKDGNTIRLTERNVSRDHARTGRRSSLRATRSTQGVIYRRNVTPPFSSADTVYQLSINK